MTAITALLRVDDLHVRYGAAVALSGISLEVMAGEIRTIVGANGAGKTTTLKALIGLVKIRHGTIEAFGGAIHDLPAHERARRGIAYVPEGRRILTGMTVQQNLLLGGHALRDRRKLNHNLERELKRFPILRERRSQSAGTLSGGEQQQLAIGRALMCDPRVLLLDEPSLGLAPLMVREVFRTIARIRDEGIAILLVEQNSAQALAIARWAYVLETGKLVLEGRASDIADDPRMQAAYLGGARASDA